MTFPPWNPLNKHTVQTYVSTLLFQAKAHLQIYFIQQFLVKDYYKEQIWNACYIWMNSNVLLCLWMPSERNKEVCFSITLHSCACILFPQVWNTYFFTQIFQSFPFTSSLPCQVVISGLKSQGKENCQAHMILILNACPIFKHLTFDHLSKNDTSPLPLQLS